MASKVVTFSFCNASKAVTRVQSSFQNSLNFWHVRKKNSLSNCQGGKLYKCEGKNELMLIKLLVSSKLPNQAKNKNQVLFVAT